MKKITIYLLFATSLFLASSCSKESDEVTKESTILFTSECEADLTNIAFISRNDEVIWQKTETTSNLNLSVKMKLEKGDEMWIRAVPADGKWYQVKTAIFIDGVELVNKEKFCQAGTGCTYIYKN